MKKREGNMKKYEGNNIWWNRGISCSLYMGCGTWKNYGHRPWDLKKFRVSRGEGVANSRFRGYPREWHDTLQRGGGELSQILGLGGTPKKRRETCQHSFIRLILILSPSIYTYWLHSSAFIISSCSPSPFISIVMFHLSFSNGNCSAFLHFKFHTYIFGELCYLLLSIVPFASWMLHVHTEQMCYSFLALIVISSSNILESRLNAGQNYTGLRASLWKILSLILTSSISSLLLLVFEITVVFHFFVVFARNWLELDLPCIT